MGQKLFGDTFVKWFNFSLWCLMVLGLSLLFYLMGLSLLSEASTLLNIAGVLLMLSTVLTLFIGAYFGIRHTLLNNEESSK